MNHNETHPVAAGGQHMHGAPIGNEGLLLSHGFLGTLVLALGTWWWIQALRQCYSAVRLGIGKYRAQVSYGSGCCPNHIGEGIAKVLLCLIGIGVEAGTIGLGRHHEYAYYPFYTTLLVAGIVDILTATVVFLPDGMDYVIHALPFVFQAYCARAQAYDQPHVTATCRHLISYTSVLAAAAILVEMAYRERLLFSWIKSFAVMLTGMWYWQSGLMLDSSFVKPWTEDSHNNVMYAAILCAWQMFFVAVFQLVVLLISAKCHGTTADWTRSRRSESVDRYGASGNNNLRDNIQYTKLLNSEEIEE